MIGSAVCALAISIVLLPLTTVFASMIFAGTMYLRYRRRRRSGREIHESQELETAIDVAGRRNERVDRRTPGQRFRRGGRRNRRSGRRCVSGGRSACPAGWRRHRGSARRGHDLGAAGAVGPARGVLAAGIADHGLAMSTLMHAAQRDIAERQRFSGQVRSGMAGARATAAILASLPVLSVMMGELIGARPVAFLLGGRLGGVLLVVGLALVCGGLLWSDHITDSAARTPGAPRRGAAAGRRPC